MNIFEIIVLVLVTLCVLTNIVAGIFCIYDCYKSKKLRQLQVETIQKLVKRFEKEG